MKICREIRTFLVPRIRICTSVVGTVLFSAFFCITFYGELNFAVFILLGELMLELCNAWDWHFLKKCMKIYPKRVFICTTFHSSKPASERMAFKWRWVNKMYYNNSNVDDLQISGFLARVMDKNHEGPFNNLIRSKSNVIQSYNTHLFFDKRQLFFYTLSE